MMETRKARARVRVCVCVEMSEWEKKIANICWSINDDINKKKAFKKKNKK